MKIGDVVENFQLRDQFNNIFDLYQNLDENILLVFYPKDNSLVCTKQLINYSLNQDEFRKNGVKIIGVNIEPVDSHNKFCNDRKIDFPLLSDPEKKVSNIFGALNVLGQNKRKIIFIGKDKKIKFVKMTLPIFFLDAQQLLDELMNEQLI
jgi:thioredoxin-dependent peroxiredoxin